MAAPLPTEVREQPTSKTSVYHQGELIYDGATGQPTAAAAAAAGAARGGQQRWLGNSGESFWPVHKQCRACRIVPCPQAIRHPPNTHSLGATNLSYLIPSQAIPHPPSIHSLGVPSLEYPGPR